MATDFTPYLSKDTKRKRNTITISIKWTTTKLWTVKTDGTITWDLKLFGDDLQD